MTISPQIRQVVLILDWTARFAGEAPAKSAGCFSELEMPYLVRSRIMGTDSIVKWTNVHGI